MQANVLKDARDDARLGNSSWGSSSVARWLATLRRATMLARVHWPLSHILVLRGTGTSVCIGRQ